MKKNRISMTFKRLTKAELLVFAATVINKMNSDPQFAKLQLNLAELSSNYDQCQNLSTAAKITGRLSTISRAASFDNLTEALDMLAKNVELLANGDESVIVASGFEVKRAEKETGLFGTPFSFEFKKHPDIGSIQFFWKKVAKAVIYQLQYRKVGETEFMDLLFSSSNSAIATDLALGVKFEFRLCAVSSDGKKSNWTNTVSSWIS